MQIFISNNVEAFLELLDEERQQRAALENTEKNIEAAKPKFISELNAVLLDGIRVYNTDEDTVYKIVVKNLNKLIRQGFDFKLDTEHYKIMLSVELYDKCNNAPIGELDTGDPERITKKLERFINPTLKANGIPFILGTITFPDEYYMK